MIRRVLSPTKTGALLLWVCWLGGAPAAALPPAGAPEAQRVVVVANRAEPDSVALARYYAAARQIPEENIVALPLPTAETITWPQFVAQVHNPLQAELLARGWIEGIPSGFPDMAGRPRSVVSGHRISYLVLMRGVPLRIDENKEWTPPPAKPGAPTGIAGCNRASVDGELALLAMPASPVFGIVANPLCKRREPAVGNAALVVRVARLDGPTPAAVRGMVDSALAGERDGLAGRAYVDIGGRHEEGDRWLENVAGQLEQAGFETEVDREKTTFPPLARFDAPVLYFGWYTGKVDGPFTVPGFRFPPGAVAVHLHSYSAQSLRTDSQFWCGPFIARGVAATVGNVFEPYLGLTHHLDLLCEALLRGETFGAAAYYALPALSWQEVALGDPLYRPLACSLVDQYAEREKLAPEQRGYVVLRRAHLALDAGRKDESLQLARAAFRDAPTIALGVSVAQLAREIEGPEAAVRELQFLELLPGYQLRDFGTVRAAAQLLAECNAPLKALALYDKLLATPPAVGEVPLLEEAIRTALRHGQAPRSAPWQDRLAKLKPAK